MKNLYLLFCIVITVTGHSYVTSPITRSNQKVTQSGCRGPACLGPCEIPLARANQVAVTSVARGSQITVQWPRNNHAGGFIRFAWASFDQSDAHSAFDNNVQMFQCHETGRSGVADASCRPSDPGNPNGGDANPADGSVGACTATLTVPGHLTDGKWTLQWAWFGGAFALGDYYSCVDYQVSGGPTTAQQKPFFRGTDYTNPTTQQCKFFNTDELHVCKNEPCEAPKKAGQNNGVPLYNGQIVPPEGQQDTTPIPSSEAPQFCPNPNAPNLDGETLYPPTCGKNSPTARCADGQCCSPSGYCGPIKDTDGQYRENGAILTYEQAVALYCTSDNQGDWRLVSCNTNAAKSMAASFLLLLSASLLF